MARVHTAGAVLVRAIDKWLAGRGDELSGDERRALVDRVRRLREEAMHEVQTEAAHDRLQEKAGEKAGEKAMVPGLGAEG